MWHAKVGEKAEQSNFNRIEDRLYILTHPIQKSASVSKAYIQFFKHRLQQVTVFRPTQA